MRLASTAKVCDASSRNTVCSYAQSRSYLASTGFARVSFAAARQLVRHNHISVNGKRVNIPSFLTRVGDVIQVAETSRKLEAIHESLRRSRDTVSWLSVDKVNLQGSVIESPSREDIPTVADEQLVIEFYSRV